MGSGIRYQEIDETEICFKICLKICLKICFKIWAISPQEFSWIPLPARVSAASLRLRRSRSPNRRRSGAAD